MTSLLSPVSRAFLRLCLLFSVVGGSTWTAYGAFPAGTPTTPYLTGQNYWYFPPDSAYATLEDSGVTLVRIGGHTFDVTPLSDAEILRQVDNIRSIGAEPIIQLSRSAGVATAVATLTYLNATNGRAVKFWSIGNEPDLGWAGTDADLAAYVAGYIKTIAPALRDVDPGITILAPDLSFYSTPRYGALLGGASDITGTDAKGRWYVDCITFHRYPFGSTYARADVLTEMHSTFEGRVNALLTLIASANALHGRSGTAALTWGLTEFNLDYSNPANNTPAGLGVSSFLNGQFFAEYYRVAVKRGVALMNTWSLLEGGGNGSSGDLGYLGGSWSAPVKRSSYYHLQMVADYMLPGGYLATTSSSANLAAWSTSSIAQSMVSVMVLNENTAGSQAFTIRLNNEPVVGPGVKVNVSANLAKEYSATIGNQTTAVLVFDAAGALRQRVTYSLTRCQASLPPLIETFPVATTPPATPGPLTVIAGDTQVTLSWPAESDSTGYNVKRATTSGGPYSTIGPGVMDTRFTDTGLTNGATYYYVVSSVNEAGEGPDSDEVGVTPPSLPPSIAFEAESLPVSVSGSSVSVNSDSGASGGKWVQLNASAIGPYFQFTTGSVPAGTYGLQLTYKANNNRGQLALAVDGTTVGGLLDEYAAASAFVTKPIGTVTFASAGAHTLRLSVTGKNPASTGYLLAADKFVLAGPTAAAITLSGLHQAYDGTPKAVSVATTPAGLATTITYDGATTPPMRVGAHPVVVVITDPSYAGAATGTLWIVDTTPPVLALPGNLVLEATSPAGAVATYAPSATDDVDGVVAVQCSPASGSTFPLGTTEVHVTATDAAGNQASGSFLVTVRDTTPPAIVSLSASPNVIWPPNKKMVPVLVVADTTDAVGVAAVTIVGVSSNEPDGRVQWQITGPLSVNLLADRLGAGAGRIYTLTIEARDAAGNVRTGTVTVAVPHDRGS